MTPAELLDLCDRAARGEAVLRLVTDGQQPIRGFRAELLCVNAAGEHVWLYSRAQARRIASALRAAESR